MSRLRIRGEWLFNGMVKVTVLEREANEYMFGRNKNFPLEYDRLFFGSKCCLIPEYGSNTTRSEGINPLDDLLDLCIGTAGDTGTLKLEDYEKLKFTVKEYNEWRDSVPLR